MENLIGIPPGSYAVAAVAVVLVGIAKAGFGGGVGLIATPLMALVLPARTAVGVLLPILCACDALAIWHYRRSFDRRALGLLVPGALVGIVLGALLLEKLDERWIRFGIGALSILFVVYEVSRQRILSEMDRFQPGWKAGAGFGIAAGLTSTLAHAAGPVTTMFLIPQGFDRKIFVGTTVIFFTIVNAVKLIPYTQQGLFDLTLSLALVPFVPIGVFTGIAMNERISQKWFLRIIFVALFLTGLQLMTGYNILDLFGIGSGGGQ